MTNDRNRESSVDVSAVQEQFEQGFLTLPMHRSMARETAVEYRRWLRLGRPVLKRQTLIAAFAERATGCGGPPATLTDRLPSDTEDRYATLYGNPPSSSWTEEFNETRYVDITPSNP